MQYVENKIVFANGDTFERFANNTYVKGCIYSKGGDLYAKYIIEEYDYLGDQISSSSVEELLTADVAEYLSNYLI